MEEEIFRQPEDKSGPAPRRTRRLDDLRRLADRYSQAAHDAIAQGLGRGDAELQFVNLRNTGGQ